MSRLQVIQESALAPRIKQGRAPRKGDAEWAAHRPLIEDLYLSQKMSVKEVMRHMANSGFVATHRQYEYHLAMWKVSKYNSRNTVPNSPSKASHVGMNRPMPSDVQAARIPAIPLEDASALPHSSAHADSEWLANFETPMLNWDSTSLFIEQELAAFNDKVNVPQSLAEATESPSAPLARFADCQFVEEDHADTCDNHQDGQNTGGLTTASEHHWQTPSSLSRLWEVEMPPSQRSAVQHYRVQRLIWCLWLCGNHRCFTSLARAAQYRIIRVEDDVSRFEASIEKWIATSLGCPESMLFLPNAVATSGKATAPGDPNCFVSDAVLRGRKEGISDWNLHARLGHHLAILRTTGHVAQASKLVQRLRSELHAAPGRWGFYSSFANVINLSQKILVRELSHMHSLDADVRKFIGVVLGNTQPGTVADSQLSDQRKAVGVLSFLCYQRWKQSPDFSPEAEALIETRTGFPIAKAFQWAFRMLLFYSCNEDGKDTVDRKISITSLAPSTLCSKALNGLSVMALFETQTVKLDDVVEKQDERLEALWLEWLSLDSAWFLPSLLPMDITETSMNIWQAIMMK